MKIKSLHYFRIFLVAFIIAVVILPAVNLFHINLPVDATAGIVTVSISASSDDSSQNSSTSAYDNSLGYLSMGRKNDGTALNIGLKFDGITINAGSTILSAYITLKAKNNGGTPSLTIKGEDTATPSTYGASEDFTSRTYTTASVNWAVSAWTLGSSYNSASIVSIVQELVDSYSYSSASMAFEILGETGVASWNVCDSIPYDDVPGDVAVLHITYSTTPNDLYWYGDSGSWTNYASHWSYNSGNSPSAPAIGVPTANDNVHFDANSFTIPAQLVDCGGLGSLYCRDMAWVGVTNYPTMDCSDSYPGGNLYIYGSLTMSSDMDVKMDLDHGYPDWYFKGEGSHTITSAGAFGGIDGTGSSSSFAEWNWHFDCTGTYTLADELYIDTNISGYCELGIEFISGNFDTNGYDITLLDSGTWGSIPYGSISVTGTTTRSVNLNDSLLTISSFNATTTTNLTADFDESTIVTHSSNFIGGNLTYGIINCVNTSSASTLSGNNTITGLWASGTGITVSGLNTIGSVNLTTTYAVFSSENEITDFSMSVASGTTNDYLTFGSDQEINGDLTLIGYDSGTNRLRVKSSVSGTNRELEVNGIILIENCDISDIYATGTGDWDISAGLNSDYGGNYGITFTTGVSVYWRGQYGGAGNNGDWSDLNMWADAADHNGGTGRIPLIQDTAIFDETSFSLPGRTVTIDMTYLPEINALDVDENPTFSKSGTVYIYGDFTIGTCSWTVTTTYFSGYDTTLISTGTITSDIYVQKTTATMNQLTLGSDLTFTGTFYLSSGIFNADGYNLTASYFNSSTTTYARVLRMGSGTWTLNGTAATAKWNAAATNLTLYCETSTLILTNSGANAQSFAGAGKAYYTVQITGAGSYTMTFSDANTIGTLYIDRNSAAKTIAGNVTLTLTNFTVPVSGTTVVTITNTDFSKSSGTVGLRYMSISGSAASGGATFFAGAAPPSTDGGGNTGWIFSDGTAPTLETYAAYDVYTSGATLSGGLITMGNFTPVYVFFQYGLSTAFGTNTTEQTMTAPAGFTQQVPSLLQDTTYYFRAVGRYYTDLYAYGDNETFVTELNESYAQNTTSAVGTYGNATGGIPPEPDDLYGELNGTNLVMNITNDVSDSAGMPRTLFWFIFAFLIICLGGIIAYNESRSLALQFIIMLCCLFGFVVGIHILPFWMIFVFIIDGIALMVASRQFGY